MNGDRYSIDFLPDRMTKTVTLKLGRETVTMSDVEFCEFLSRGMQVEFWMDTKPDDYCDMEDF